MLRSLVAAPSRSPVATALRRFLHTGSDGNAEEMESVAYRMSMLRAPPVMQKRPGLTRNSCSLIGRLVMPVHLYENSSDEEPRAYTLLSISSSSTRSSSSSNFRVILQLNGELANVSLKHLKRDDLVYVSGLLSSYCKVDASCERYIFYKIYVAELNYVLDRNQKSQNDEASTSEMLPEKKYADRLRLWQVFFASPYEWWDNRNSKPHFRCADFKHKDTRETLFLHPDDPPWVRRQLELHDLEIAQHGRRDKRCLLKNNTWKSQDFDYSDDDEEHHFAEA